ncbi:hypothetical protein NJBCHELONAE_22790 [Mycobacteroides chelonae]|nr:hypothetical protein NJBCHELONAE_22790 [Mycobacteroides chelonae]
MHGIPAEITQKVGVLFQDDDVDPRPRQQECMHQPGGAAAGNAHLSLQNLRHTRDATPEPVAAGVTRAMR